MKEIKI